MTGLSIVGTIPGFKYVLCYDEGLGLLMHLGFLDLNPTFIKPRSNISPLLIMIWKKTYLKARIHPQGKGFHRPMSWFLLSTLEKVLWWPSFKLASERFWGVRFNGPVCVMTTTFCCADFYILSRRSQSRCEDDQDLCRAHEGWKRYACHSRGATKSHPFREAMRQRNVKQVSSRGFPGTNRPLVVATPAMVL